MSYARLYDICFICKIENNYETNDSYYNYCMCETSKRKYICNKCIVDKGGARCFNCSKPGKCYCKPHTGIYLQNCGHYLCEQCKNSHYGTLCWWCWRKPCRKCTSCKKYICCYTENCIDHGELCKTCFNSFHKRENCSKCNKSNCSTKLGKCSLCNKKYCYCEKLVCNRRGCSNDKVCRSCIKDHIFQKHNNDIYKKCIKCKKHNKTVSIKQFIECEYPNCNDKIKKTKVCDDCENTMKNLNKIYYFRKFEDKWYCRFHFLLQN